MTELKTLKELELPIGTFIGNECGNHLVVDLKELRREAIKWIKWIQDEDCILHGKFKNEVLDDRERLRVKAGMVFFALTFFNITEEDLK